MQKVHFIVTVFLYLSFTCIHGAHEVNIQVTGIDSPPYGPFYCQARCLASCIETNLAPSMEECAKFCPPFDAAMPCPQSSFECWRTCGIAPMPRDRPPPPAVSFIMAQHVANADPRVQDPFTIALTWDPSPSASLYIVEMYPLNRKPRPGENNFFRALTSQTSYTVRKEDECTIYDIRVLPVNAFGVGAPQYTRIEAPRPVMTGPENFFVQSIKRDPINENFLLVNIEYALLASWPVLDVDLIGIRVKAIECRAIALQNNTASKFGIQADNAWYPFYDISIQKAPTPRIQLAFLNEVVKSDCLFQMRVSALTTRCNTTTHFDSNGGSKQDSTVGVDFRINCLTAEGFSCSDDVSVQQSIVASSMTQIRAVIPPAVPPAVLPAEVRSMPIPPPIPLFSSMINETFTAPIVPQVASTRNEVPDQMPAQSSNVVSINENTHPLLIDYLAINAQPIPAICDIDTLDVRASPSVLGTSLVDLAVAWSERNPNAQYSPTYFIVRYGPVVRSLVEDARKQQKIMAGKETIVRTGAVSMAQSVQGLPERRIKVVGVPKGALLSFQVCAIYDPTVEQLISWDTVPNQRVDLQAIQPSNTVITSLAPLATDESPLSAGRADIIPDNSRSPLHFDNKLDRKPIIVQVGIVDARPFGHPYWLLLGGTFVILLTGAMIFMSIVRHCLKSEKHKILTMNPLLHSPPIAVITKAYPQNQKEQEVEKQAPEKIALP